MGYIWIYKIEYLEIHRWNSVPSVAHIMRIIIGRRAHWLTENLAHPLDIFEHQCGQSPVFIVFVVTSCVCRYSSHQKKACPPPNRWLSISIIIINHLNTSIWRFPKQIGGTPNHPFLDGFSHEFSHGLSLGLGPGMAKGKSAGVSCMWTSYTRKEWIIGSSGIHGGWSGEQSSRFGFSKRICFNGDIMG